MKLTINKKVKTALVGMTIILISIFIYLTYIEISKSAFEEKKIPIYSYSNKGIITYNVYLKPNLLYEDNKQDEGKIYLYEFIDYLETNLKYEFNGERAADIKGEYNIIAKVQGYTGEGENLIYIWEKEFPISQYNWFNTKNGKVSVNEIVKLDLDEYNSFVKEIKEATFINCQTALTLTMNIKISGIIDKVPIKEEVSPNLTIPLDVAMFEITGNNIVDKPGVIEENIRVQIPINKTLVIVFGLIIAILLITLIVLLFFIKIAPEKDQLEKDLSKIFKKHGDRLVALNSDIDLQNAIVVKSIDDLVKIADEVGKPILYKYSDNYKEINKFYVTNNDEVFLYVLEYSDMVEQIEYENEIIENTTESIKTESQLNV